MTINPLPTAQAHLDRLSDQAAVRISVIFWSLSSGIRAVRYLLAHAPVAPFDVVLFALAEPLVPGTVRIHQTAGEARLLASEAAAEWLRVLGRELDDFGASHESLVVVGPRARICEDTLRRDGFDFSIVAMNGLSWANRLLLRWQTKRYERVAGRPVVVVP